MLWVTQKYVETDDCEDVVHEAFLKVIRAADMLLRLPDHKMQMYILLIVRGTAIDFLRKEHRYLQVDLEDNILHSFITDQGEKAVGGYGKTELVGGTDTGMRTKLHRARKRVFNEWTESGLHMEDFLDE